VKLLILCSCGCERSISGTKAYARANSCKGCKKAFSERCLFVGRIDENSRAITIGSGHYCALCHPDSNARPNTASQLIGSNNDETNW
jgi:hypothetical protein